MRYGKSQSSFLGTIVKLLIAAAIIYLSYILFKYAAAKGDWGFIISPLKSLFKSV